MLLDGEAAAVSEDAEVTSNRAVRQMEDRIRELERQLSRKTLEVEILKEALDKTRKKRRGSRSHSRSTVPGEGRDRNLGRLPFPPESRQSGSAKLRRRYNERQDAAVLHLITTLVAMRSTYGYGWITALLNR